jgi:hypothetical protein
MWWVVLLVTMAVSALYAIWMKGGDNQEHK